MFRKFLALAQVTLVSVFTLIGILLFLWAFLVPRKKRERLVMKYGAHRWASFILAYLGVDVRRSGEENIPSDNKGYLSISNHLSFIDIPALMIVLRCAFMLKSSLFWLPFGWGAYLIGSIGVERGNAKSQIKAMYHAFEMSLAGICIHVFPEGSRSLDGELLPLKTGMLGLAFKRKVPVLVSGVWGTQHISPPKSVDFNSSAPCAIHVHGILNPKDFEDLKTFVEATTSALKSATETAKQALNKP